MIFPALFAGAVPQSNCCPWYRRPSCQRQSWAKSSGHARPATPRNCWTSDESWVAKLWAGATVLLLSIHHESIYDSWNMMNLCIYIYIIGFFSYIYNIFYLSIYIYTFFFLRILYTAIISSCLMWKICRISVELVQPEIFIWLSWGPISRKCMFFVGQKKNMVFGFKNHMFLHFSRSTRDIDIYIYIHTTYIIIYIYIHFGCLFGTY